MKESDYQFAESDNATIEQNYLINSVYLNPFNPTTTISFFVPGNGNVELVLYDISGRVVETLICGDVSSGYHRVSWDGTSQSIRNLLCKNYQR